MPPTLILQYYVAEVTTPKRRGLFTASYHFSVIVGITLAYGVGVIPALSYNHSAVVITGIVIIFEILMLVVPESPRWLLSKGHEAQAMKALQWLRGSKEIAREEADEIKKFIETTPKLSLKEKLLEFRKRHVYLPMMLVASLIFVHQVSGINPIIAYAATILKTAGVDRARETALYTIGGLQIVAAAMCSLLVDLIGRKPLLILGSIGLTISSTSLGTHFYITRPSLCKVENSTNVSDVPGPPSGTDDPCNPQFAIFAVCSLVSFCFAYSFGWRCLPSIVASEIYPLRVRGVLGGISDSYTWTLGAVSTGFYYEYEQAVHPYTAWWSFAFVSFISIFFVLIFLPETKGKALEEIESYFKGKTHTATVHSCVTKSDTV